MKLVKATLSQFRICFLVNHLSHPLPAVQGVRVSAGPTATADSCSLTILRWCRDFQFSSSRAHSAYVVCLKYVDISLFYFTFEE